MTTQTSPLGYPKTLADVFAWQRELMEILGVDDAPVESPLDDRVVDAVLGLSAEIGEVSQELALRSRIWANMTPEESLVAVAMEAIDIFFYLVELFVLLGYEADDLVDMYGEKLLRNFRRAEDAASSIEHYFKIGEKVRRLTENKGK